MAEYMTQNPNGTFTLVGAGFNRIIVSEFPAVQPLMFLFIRFCSSGDDVGVNKVEVKLTKGKEAIFTVKSIIEVDPDFHSDEDYVNLPLRIANIRFETGGEYRVRVLVNGEELASQCLRFSQLPPATKEQISPELGRMETT